eukprot:SAG31_NODE_4048_length_3637_cov_23.139062_1_plen_468_part_10
MPGPWSWEEQLGASTVWSAPLPHDLRSKVVRQLYSDGTRLVRTRTPASDIGFPSGVKRVRGGFETVSAADRLTSNRPGGVGVELVSDHTWVQHRCPITAVTKLPAAPPPAPAPPAPLATCKWSPVVRGHSPGSSLKQTSADNVGGCQRKCCAALPKCKAVIFDRGGSCFLLDRSYEGNYGPSPTSVVADLNCTARQQPTCGPAEPLARMQTMINVSQACWETASKHSGINMLSAASVAWFENTGEFSTAGGQFYIDAVAGRVLVSTAHRTPQPSKVIAAVTQTLLSSEGANDIEWHDLSFVHSGWPLPSTTGIVERYGGTLFQLGAAEPNQLMSSAAAVDVGDAKNIRFVGCTFAKLGAWGLRLRNGTQGALVSRCNFSDLSGGAICVGDWHDMMNPSERQMAEVIIEDNTMIGMGVEFGGAPAVHSYCMRQSSISHNHIQDVAYAGISYNWPSPQGPTLGGQDDMGF